MQENSKNIAIVGSDFLGLALALRVAETGAAGKCGDCDLNYLIKNKLIVESSRNSSD